MIEQNSLETYERVVFDCPVHGLETSIGCFRAHYKENDSRWVRQIVTIETVGYLTKEEGRKIRRWKEQNE